MLRRRHPVFSSIAAWTSSRATCRASRHRAGIWQGLVGSLILIVFVARVAVPARRSAAAIYIEEYARDTPANRFINANIRNLAGVPSIVYGILGLAIFVQVLRPVTGPDVHGRSSSPAA